MYIDQLYKHVALCCTVTRVPSYSGHKGTTPGGTVPGQNPGGTMYTKRHLVWSGHSDGAAWETETVPGPCAEI